VLAPRLPDLVLGQNGFYEQRGGGFEAHWAEPLPFSSIPIDFYRPLIRAKRLTALGDQEGSI